MSHYVNLDDSIYWITFKERTIFERSYIWKRIRLSVCESHKKSPQSMRALICDVLNLCVIKLQSFELQFSLQDQFYDVPQVLAHHSIDGQQSSLNGPLVQPKCF